MVENFTTFEIAKLLEGLDFKLPKEAQFGRFSLNGDLYPFPLLSAERTIIAPLWQQAIDWFINVHRFHIQISPIPYDKGTKTAYFYNIAGDNPSLPIYDYQDKYSEVLDASVQDVPSHYLNDELHDKNLFDLDFAYKTYNEALEKVILKAIEILKQ